MMTVTVLGVCNGFRALVKLGLVPNGAITGQTEESPTLTYDTIRAAIFPRWSLPRQ
ncbi:MAG: phosphoribosylformylglycinamidine synthase subunit PurQ [[Clostridium] scindens]